MMKRMMLLVVLSLFVFTAVVTAEETKTGEKKSEGTEVQKEKVEPKTDSGTRIIAYYFHQTKRCPSCKKIEAYTKETIENEFAEELKSGKLEFLPINVDEEGNGHYMDDYELFTKSVILSRVVDGKETEWKNLQKIWELLNSKEKFSEYIVSEIKTFMKEG